MALRSKREKEMKRHDKAKMKADKRAQKKLAKQNGEWPPAGDGIEPQMGEAEGLSETDAPEAAATEQIG